MQRTLILVLLVAATAGCESMMVDRQQMARDDWNTVRADSACERAAEHLAAGQLVQAQVKAHEAIELDEDYVPARIVIAKINIEQGHFQAAINHLEQALMMEPDNPEVVFLLAVGEERVGKLDRALDDYTRAYELDESNFSAVLAAAEVLVAMERVSDAAKYLAKHMGRADNDPGAYELAARLAMMQGQHDRAADYYQAAWELDQSNIDYEEAMGLAQAMAGRHAEAAATLSDRIARSDPPAAPWVYATLGDSHLALGDRAEAIAAYRKLCELRPDAVSWVSLAKAHLESGATAEVIQSATRALELEADNADALSLLGYALIETGQCERAITLLAPAAQTQPENTMLQCLLGQAYDALGEPNRARNCYSEAVRLEPENALAWALLRDVSTRGSASR